MGHGVPASAERLEDGGGHANGHAVGRARDHGGGNGRRSVGTMLRRSALRSQGDDRLVTLARSGVAPAFEVIVERYRAPLNRYCARMVGPEHAEDVVQETFASAYSALLDDDRPLNLKPWLYRVAHNTAITSLRSKSWSWEELDESHDGVRQPPDHAELSERLHLLVARMRTLPERQRVAIVLQELEGRSPEEIAREIDGSVPGVRLLVHRARAQLRTSCGALIPLPFLVKLFNPSVAAAKSGVAGASAVSASVSVSKVVVVSAIGLVGAGSVIASGELRPKTQVEPSSSHAPVKRGTGGDAPLPTARHGGRDVRGADAKGRTAGGEAVTPTPAVPGGESGSQEPAAAQPGGSQAPTSLDRGEPAPGGGPDGGASEGERDPSSPSGGEPSPPKTPVAEGPAPPTAGGGTGSGGSQAAPTGGNGGGNGDGSGKGHGGGHGGGLGQGGGGGNGGGKHL